MRYDIQITTSGGGPRLAVSAASIEDVLLAVRDFDKTQLDFDSMHLPAYTVKQEQGTLRTARRLERWVVRDRHGIWCGSFRNERHANYYCEGLIDGKWTTNV